MRRTSAANPECTRLPPSGVPGPVPPHPEGDNGANGGLKSERTRQRILDAAARTFRNQGFAGTTLNDIANAAQLRAGSIYYHFDSKERLLEEVLDIGIARVATAVKEEVDGLPPETSPTERIATESKLTCAACFTRQSTPPRRFESSGRLLRTQGNGFSHGARTMRTIGEGSCNPPARPER